MLQLGEVGARELDPPLLRAEVHKHGVIFHAEDDAEPVLIVGDLIVDGERLDRGAYGSPTDCVIGDAERLCLRDVAVRARWWRLSRMCR